MPNPSDQQANAAPDRLQMITKWRDVGLATVGCLYALGYLTWAVYAWGNDLGLLPTLEFQYIIAGVVPALAILTLLLVIVGGCKFRGRIQAWLPPSVTGWKSRLRWCIFAAALLSLAVSMGIVLIGGTSVDFGEPKIFLVFVFTYLIWAFAPDLPSKQDDERAAPKGEKTVIRNLKIIVIRILTIFGLFRPIGVIVVVLISLIFLMVGLAYFFEEVYPNIPQELGGAEPRCAQLDVLNADLSAETCAVLVPRSRCESESQVVQTVEVDVFFSGSDFMLVRPRSWKAKAQIYEIRKGIIKAVTWCD